jgi:hypothetical protein
VSTGGGNTVSVDAAKPRDTACIQLFTRGTVPEMRGLFLVDIRLTVVQLPRSETCV